MNQDRVSTGICPLAGVPCPQGAESVEMCRLQVQSGFDPVASFGHLCILECAKERAATARQRKSKLLS